MLCLRWLEEGADAAEDGVAVATLRLRVLGVSAAFTVAVAAAAVAVAAVGCYNHSRGWRDWCLGLEPEAEPSSTASIPRVPHTLLPAMGTHLSSHYAMRPRMRGAEGECLGGSRVLSQRRNQHPDVLQLLNNAHQSVTRAVRHLDVRVKDDEAAVGGDEFLLHGDRCASRR